MIHTRGTTIERLLTGLIAIWLAWVTCRPASVLPVASQDEDLAAALAGIGVANPSITVDDNVVTVAFTDDVDRLGAWETVLYKMANIIDLAGSHPEGRETVSLQITGPDGHTLEVKGNVHDAAAFKEGELLPEAYEDRLRFTPITRGPVLVAGMCDVDAGQNCANADACACYPNETCAPESDKADNRGCVADSAPENAHLVDAQYVCDEGYVWNSRLTGCEAPITCPEGSFLFNGSCTELVKANPPSGEREPVDNNAGGGSWLSGLLVLCGAGLCLLVPVGIILLIVLRRRKRRSSTDEARTPIEGGAANAGVSVSQALATPAAPRLPEPFSSLETQYVKLKQQYAAGQLSQDAYHLALQQLVVQDARGHWAYSSGQWMWFDGTQWVPRHAG